MDTPLVCGDPLCLCALEAPSLVEDAILGETEDLVDDVIERVDATVESAIKEAYLRGYHDGVRETLDATQVGSPDPAPGYEPAQSVEGLDEALALLETDFDALTDSLDTWAPGIDAALRYLYEAYNRQGLVNEGIARFAESVLEGLNTVAGEVADLSENTDADALGLDALGLQVQDNSRKIDLILKALAEDGLFVPSLG